MSDERWTLGDVLEFVEHPTRMIRINPQDQINKVFQKINNLGKILNKFDPEYQEELVSNFIDTMEQLINE